MATTVQAIIFDLGRVLVDVKFNRESLEFFGVRPEDRNMEQILTAAFNNPLFRAYNMGKISTDDFYRAFIEEHQLQMDFETFKTKWCSVFAPVDGMESLFWQVKKRYPVGLLSDTDPLHWNYCLEHFPFLQSIEKPTLSFEIGALKPEAVCYIKAAQNVGLPPERCLFIDDRPVNVQGAKAVGMQAIVFEGAGPLKEKLRQMGISV
ncbi:hypothetical protein DRI50_01300 [candidate division KSB1 bacterium]|nr:MAG: hypothetical protein DRI50_01300 [candidate division KSB1 bacterium]